jgi:tRNA (guanine-N7-)-methyltransferase
MLQSHLPPLRTIRSFVLRQGRITAGQKEAYQALIPRYGLSLPPSGEMFNWQAIFGREAPRILEIGFGMGERLVEEAASLPEKDFVGVEVHPPGVGRCLQGIEEAKLKNIRILPLDVHLALGAIPPQSLDMVYILFPDPWPKKRHHKRRLITPDFVNTLAQKLKEGGIFHLATDWEDYALWMQNVLEASSSFYNQFGACQFAPVGIRKIQTKFEQRGKRLHLPIYDLVYVRSPVP